MLSDCGFHQSEDTRNCCIYVTFVIIFTFTVVILFKLGTLSAAIFLVLLLALALSRSCEWCSYVCAVSNNMGSDEADVSLLLKLCIKQK